MLPPSGSSPVLIAGFSFLNGLRALSNLNYIHHQFFSFTNLISIMLFSYVTLIIVNEIGETKR